MNFENTMLNERSQSHRPHLAPSHLYAMSRTGKATDSEQIDGYTGLSVRVQWGRRREESDCYRVLGFFGGVIRTFSN